MDIRQQLQRLLDIADDARRRAAELSETHAGAAGELDRAEYDLQRVIDEVRGLLGESKVPAADAPVTPGAEARRTGQPARRRSA
jgi:hypothetical protein